MSNKSDKKPPAHTVRRGKIIGRCWENEGAGGPWYSVTVVREYKRPANEPGSEFATASSFGVDDLLAVAEIARMCWTWIHVHSKAKS